MSSEAPSLDDDGSISRNGGGNVVLAEDDGDLREALALAMRREGHEVVELANGWELLQHLAMHMLADGSLPPIDVVISDVRMPGKSGLDVLAGVQWARQPVPFILITAFADSQTRAEAWRLGAVAFLSKPFSLDDIRTLVRDAVSRQVP